MKSGWLWLAGLSLWCLAGYAQNRESQVKARVGSYFLNYQTSYTTDKDKCRLERVCVDTRRKRVDLYTNELFAGQPFTTDKVNDIYRQVKQLLPSPYNTYRLTIYGNGTPIEQLVTDILTSDSSSPKRWGKALYNGAPWVERLHRPYPVTRGLQKRHLALWASHGRYYKNDKKAWSWQRPYLYCTTEDLFTQTIVVPFLIPMLENAGAYVFTPRERDWQPCEAIVDNDTPRQGGSYTEQNGKMEWEEGGRGFAHIRQTYLDGENPFTDGTYRRVHAVDKKSQASQVRWTPDIPVSGRYAVYVSYATLPTSVPDAQYVVRHRGITTTFRVNQQMGGGTWVYLGTFDFEQGRPEANYVSLSNLSNHRGDITADGVRFGGGMGNIARGDARQECVSGMPRYLEGARYNAQWSGMPYAVYSSKNGANDYGDDINVRAFMANYLAGGSSYLPADSGLHVPLELSIALHSDAGIASDDTYIGTLGIYTTGFNDGLLAAGLSRRTSRDLCDLVMSQVETDLSHLYGAWKRRQMFDRNYSETREPQVPSMILEMFSHQNFNDMVMGHDPAFKFSLARAIYKGILKYSSAQHGTDCVVQPLPVTAFRTQVNEEGKEILLAWQPQQDPLEPSASPKGYIVYTRKGDNGFDNGTLVREPYFRLQAEEDVIYSFRVCAVNDGGESFPSEELSAMIAKGSKASVLIIDGFQRVAGPQVVQTASLRGFDLTADEGVPYVCSPALSGSQLVFDVQNTPKADWGFSGNELEGRLIAGNTFDHSRLHGESIATVPRCSFASASRAAVEQQLVDLNVYNVVDLILGLQKDDGYSSRPYPTLTPALCNALHEFTRMRGSLLVSGAYVGRDQKSRETLDFIRNTLKIDAYAPVELDNLSQMYGMNTNLHLFSTLNDAHYAVTHADCLMPVAPAFSTLLYTPANLSAAIAYKGDNYRTITLGFPFECIKYAADRDKIMKAFLVFLLER